MLELLRVSLLEFHSLEVVRDYCTIELAVEKARDLTVIIKKVRRLKERAA
jgi:hypothetical protein